MKIGLGRGRGLVYRHEDWRRGRCVGGRMRRVVYTVVGGLLGLIGGLGSPVTAQTAPGTARQGPLPATLAPVAPAGLVGPADTMMVPGRQDFTRYTTPGACLRAALAVEAAAHFADEDTAAVYDRTRATLARPTVALARRCGARFTAATTAATDLLDLLHLALLMGEDTLARTAGERYAASITDPEAHRWALYAVDTTYLSATPLRLAAAEAGAARLDSLGAVAAVQRAKVHAWLLLHARLRYDLAAMEREAVATVAADNQLTAADRALWDGGDGGGGDAAAVLFSLELYREPTGVAARTEQRLKALGYTQWHANMPLPGGLDRGLAQIGKPPPPLRADFWVGGDSAARGWPVPGTVSVCLSSALNGPSRDDAAELRQVAVREAARMAMWRRLLRQYGAALAVTVLVKTRGAFQGGPPLAPAEEAAQLGKFYREELKVPVTVAVQTTPVKQLADGRRVRGPAPFERDPYYSEQFLLVNRDGRVALALPGFELEEAMLTVWLTRAVGHEEKRP